MNKVKAGTEAFSNSQQAFKVLQHNTDASEVTISNVKLFQFDVNDVVGMTFSCPKQRWEDCKYSTQILSQMNTHLRKHTK